MNTYPATYGDAILVPDIKVYIVGRFATEAANAEIVE